MTAKITYNAPEEEQRYRVEFQDGGFEFASGENGLIAAKRASRKYNRGKLRHVKTLRAVKA